MATDMKVAEALAHMQADHDTWQRRKKYVLSNLFVKADSVDAAKTPEAVSTAWDDIKTLEARRLATRSAVAKSDAGQTLTVGQVQRSIIDWLIWAEEVAFPRVCFLREVLEQFAAKRSVSLSAGVGQLAACQDEADVEQELADLESTIGGLRAQLAISNATVTVSI